MLSLLQGIYILLVALVAILTPLLIPQFSSKPLAVNSPADSSLYCISTSTATATFSISTLTRDFPNPQCFRVQDGIFTEILAKVPHSNNEHITYLHGHVLPGIIESHGHILAYGEMLESVSLYGANSMEDVRHRIKRFLVTWDGEGYGTSEKWIRGIGWDQQFFDGVMPTAKEISEDPELKGLYIMLDRVDVHCVLVSETVLELLPNPLPEAPPGGEIIRDPGVGVFCDNAMDAIILPVAPKPDIVQKTRWFKHAMRELNAVGIVGVGDAGMRATDIAILEGMAENGELSIRINVMLECTERNTYCPDEVQGLKLNNSRGYDSMLMLGGVKLFADGALGSWGAALLAPYSDKQDIKGTMLVTEVQLTSVVKEWYEAGFQVNIHAIGDRANRAAVDAFEKVLGSDCDGCNEARRLRIEHAQIIHPDDQKRIARMGVIPSIQPTHATSDMAYAAARLGPERLAKSAYRMKSLFPLTEVTHESIGNKKYPGPVLGSDFPVEPPNPFHGMYAAVTRLNPATGTSPSGNGGWYPAEALSVEEAVLGFTRNAAYGWFAEDRTGSIEVGKWADWIVVDTDIWADQTGGGLKEVQVMETWVSGRKVFDGGVVIDM